MKTGDLMWEEQCFLPFVVLDSLEDISKAVELLPRKMYIMWKGLL